MTAKSELHVDDVLDLRAYERVRDEFRREVVTRKRLRRISVGPIVTLLFECEETVRFQVQEMARVERIATDEGIQAELDVYNKLLPSPGELSATLFVELTSEEDLRVWLPRLVGIERSVLVELGSAGASADGDVPAEGPVAVRSVPEAGHAEALTREAVTPAVHYLRFPFAEEQVVLLATGPAALAVRHPDYEHRTELSEATRRQLVADLQGRTEPLPAD
ncbi:MAG: DUF3501 family protein [Acidimicrobiales bacterium]